MSALLKLVKAFGVNVEQHHIDAVEKIIPQIPRIVEQGITTINGAISNFDARLKALESISETNRVNQTVMTEHQLKLEEMLQEILIDVRNRRDRDNERTATGNGTGNDNRKHRSDKGSSNSRR